MIKVYRKRGQNIKILYNLRTFINFFLQRNQKIKIVYFSGLSILLAPFFISCKKHIFLTHGFYVFEYINNEFLRSFKRILYEFFISNSLNIFKWVFCIAPSPISGLVNSLKLSKKISIVQWGVDDEYINYALIDKSYRYHLTFLGRPNSQKIKKNSIDIIIKLFINSKIVNSPKDLKIAFVIPKLNKYSKSIINQLEEIHNCKIDIYENKSNKMKREILSETLYLFSCYEWEAFGITYIEALCMGCNILIPSTSPIIPMIENIENAPVYKYTPPELLNFYYFKNYIKLSKNRPSLRKVQYYRSIFNWDTIIDNIHKIVNE